MKVKAEDILKPGAVLEVRKIDFNDPDIMALADQTKREQLAILRYKIVTRKTLDAVITNMTQEDIKEGNEKIARFMGGMFHKLNDGFKENELYWFEPGNHPNPHCNAGTYKRAQELEYHKRFDWLMPVVAKIGQLHHEAWPSNEKFIEMIMAKEQPADHHYMDVVAMPMHTPINEVFESIIKFIDWYNQQTEKK